MRNQFLIASAFALGLAACQSGGAGSTGLKVTSSAGATGTTMGASAPDTVESSAPTLPTGAAAATSPLDTTIANGRTATP